ncbi:hypothetical protein [Streptomyces sp. NPDC059142]|uniref:hypothetical protein n=1 Tax=unclassified Streptomyces TaxID=2593676 RepID=UPI0036C7477F
MPGPQHSRGGRHRDGDDGDDTNEDSLPGQPYEPLPPPSPDGGPPPGDGKHRK